MRVQGRPAAWSAVVALVVLAGGAAVTSALTAPAHPSAAPRAAPTTLPTAVFSSPPTRPATTLPVPTGCQGLNVPNPSPHPTTTPTPLVSGPWAEKLVSPASGNYSVVLGDSAAFFLTPGQVGPNRLQMVDLHTGAVTNGPVFAASSLAVADGYLWLFRVGPTTAPSQTASLCQVNPQTLQLVHQLSVPWPQPPQPSDALFTPVVNGGPGGSIWVGIRGSLMRVDVVTGAVLFTTTVPSGSVSYFAVDPTNLYLYATLRYGDFASAQVDEFDAVSGRLLASTPPTSPVNRSAGDVRLTATPTTLWVTFRTGMDGATIVLRQSGLTMVTPPGQGLPTVDNIFGWPMSESVFYGDGTIWVANVAGYVACLDPETGAVRASEQIPHGSLSVDDLLAVDPSVGRLYGDADNGIVAVTPPSTCWG